MNTDDLDPNFKGDMTTHPTLVYTLLLRRLGVKHPRIYVNLFRTLKEE